MGQRKVAWFSCGVASAVATKLALKEKHEDEEFVIAYIYIKEEHIDSMRFLRECEAWFNYPITILKDSKYNASVDEVIATSRYMAGVYGAHCTRVLKKAVRYKWQRSDDIHIFGMTFEERHRLNRLIDTEPNIQFESPLIKHKFTKKDCFDYFTNNAPHIELPMMYKLGYHNNNCIGCVKAGGAGYWNKIRIEFPEVFRRRAEQERLLNVALCKMSASKFQRLYPDYYNKMLVDYHKGLVSWKQSDKTLRIPLRYLPPDAGSHKDLDIGACGMICERKDTYDDDDDDN